MKKSDSFVENGNVSFEKEEEENKKKEDDDDFQDGEKGNVKYYDPISRYGWGA